MSQFSRFNLHRRVVGPKPTVVTSKDAPKESVFNTRKGSTSYLEVNLHLKDGTSDKTYHACLAKVTVNGADEWQILTAYGRRGKPLNHRDLTETDKYAARREFDKLVCSKINKGYKVTGWTTVSSTSDKSLLDTAIYNCNLKKKP